MVRVDCTCVCVCLSAIVGLFDAPNRICRDGLSLFAYVRFRSFQWQTLSGCSLYLHQRKCIILTATIELHFKRIFTLDIHCSESKCRVFRVKEDH